MEDEEQWRDIPGYRYPYQVSSTGRVRGGKWHKQLKQKLGFYGNYYVVVLAGKDGKQHTVSVHRLVATAFIPNPDNLPIVNHKDEIKTNNRADNLEWCTHQYNSTYNGAHIKKAQKIKKKVFAYGEDGNLKAIFDSDKECCMALNRHTVRVCECLKGKRATCAGFVLSHTELSKEQVLSRFKRRDTFIRKRKVVYELDPSGKIINTFNSIYECAKITGLDQASIKRVCEGVFKQIKGRSFVFADTYKQK